MKHKILGLVAVALLAGPMAAQATSFNIAFTQAGLGDDGPDWFGTFEAPAEGGPVTSISVLLDGTTYSHLLISLDFNPADDIFPSNLIGFVTDVAPQPGVTTAAIGFRIQGNPGDEMIFGIWSIGDCTLASCRNGPTLGAYVITPAAVPEPGTLALLGLGLAGLGFTRRRRAN